MWNISSVKVPLEMEASGLYACSRLVVWVKQGAGTALQPGNWNSNNHLTTWVSRHGALAQRGTDWNWSLCLPSEPLHHSAQPFLSKDLGCSVRGSLGFMPGIWLLMHWFNGVPRASRLFCLCNVPPPLSFEQTAPKYLPNWVFLLIIYTSYHIISL